MEHTVYRKVYKLAKNKVPMGLMRFMGSEQLPISLETIVNMTATAIVFILLS